MRKLMWFAVGFAAACAVGVYLLFDFWYLPLALSCLLCGCAMLFLRGKPVKITAAVLFGCAVAFSWLWCFDCLYLSPARSCDGEDTVLTVRVSDYSFPTDYGSAFDGYCELGTQTYAVRCYVDEELSVAPGAVVEGTFRLRYTADGGKLEPTYHQSKGIFLLAYQKDIQNISQAQIRLRDYPAIWRQKLIKLIESTFSADSVAFAKALLLGDTTGFTYECDRNLQVSGLRHVVAVSGLHVSILFSLVYMVFGRHRVWNVVVGVPLLLVFAAIAGFTPSIVRACLMQCLMLFAMLAEKEYDPPTALSFAVLVILCVNPRTITSVGFQLSVGCMIGIFTFSEPLRQYLLSFGKLKEKSKGKSNRAKLIRWFTGSVSVTLSATVTTLPLCAVYFGMVSLVGVIANLLTLWVISFVFYGIMLSCVGALIWLPLGKGIAWLTAWPIRYVLGIADLLGDFPLAAVYTESSYIVLWMVLSYLFFFVLLVRKKKRPLYSVSAVVLLLILAIGISWLTPGLDETRVAVLDVGQGQSILIQHGNARYLVDCGGNHADSTANDVTNYLFSQGIFHLDGVFVTHYDGDHAGSIPQLLKFVKAEKIYMPQYHDSNGMYQQIEDAYPDTIEIVDRQTIVKTENGSFHVFPAQEPGNDNESSMCVLFQSENCDILITGDRSASGERALLEQTSLPKLDILVVGHHGSKNATSHELLKATRPRYAVISVGEDNDYGHPHPDVLERLQLYGCTVLRTDRQGTILFRR